MAGVRGLEPADVISIRSLLQLAGERPQVGRARLSTKPAPTATPTTGNTIGAVRVSCSSGPTVFARGQDDVRRDRGQFRRVSASVGGIGRGPAGVDPHVAAAPLDLLMPTVRANPSEAVLKHVGTGQLRGWAARTRTRRCHFDDLCCSSRAKGLRSTPLGEPKRICPIFQRLPENDVCEFEFSQPSHGVSLSSSFKSLGLPRSPYIGLGTIALLLPF